MIDRSHLKLGRKPVRHDPRTLELANYVTALPKPKKSCDWTKGIPSWPMDGNDTLGDCTIAGIAHAMQTWSFWGGSYSVPKLADILSVYRTLSPDDSGCDMLTVLNYMRKHGLGGHKIAAFAKVNPLNTDHVRIAIDLFGGLYTGVALPISAQTQNWLWTVKTGPDAVPGSWGLHCIWIPKHTAGRFGDITWGEELSMTLGFEKVYVDEAYAVLSTDWLGADKVSPAGLNVAQLLADAKAL